MFRGELNPTLLKGTAQAIRRDSSLYKVDWFGLRFGKVRLAEFKGRSITALIFGVLCDCGWSGPVFYNNLTAGGTVSCGDCTQQDGKYLTREGFNSLPELEFGVFVGTYNGEGTTRTDGSCLSVIIGQSSRTESIPYMTSRILDNFGGVIGGPYKSTNGRLPVYKWDLNGVRAEYLIRRMLLCPELTQDEKRPQLERAITQWETRPTKHRTTKWEGPSSTQSRRYSRLLASR